MNRKLLTTLVLLALAAFLALPGPADAARLPRGFIGISPQNPANEADYELMVDSGIHSVRLPLYWLGVEPRNPFLGGRDWSGFDAEVELAAEAGLRVFPFVWGTPSWVAPQAQIEPTRSPWALRAWVRFLHRAVRRYGADGVFWRTHPKLPYLPVRMWEVWNEENIVTFAAHSSPERFARLVRASGRTIHAADPRAKAIIGGLFGRPLQVPPNVALGDFLERLYAAGGVKPYFDGVALHPYVATARAMTPQLRTMRRVMRSNGDGRTPIYVTELGWGSDSYETRWERGMHGQARELNRAFSILARYRRAWRIGGVWWFSWADEPGAHCQFCDSSGLLTAKREAKPAWYRFNIWTGGDAATVPQLKLGR
jgi:polysaccharide biosynthesis protein PslG